MAGNYSGGATFTYPELQTSVACSATTTITQAGATVTIAPMILGGPCGGLSISVGQVTIDTTGAIEGGTASGSYYEASYSGTYNYPGSGGFFDRDLRISAVYTSDRCWNFNFTGVLTR